MPLTEKGRKILAEMQEQYGEEKGKQVFYASKNAGRITGVDNTPSEENPRDNTWPVGPVDTVLIDVLRSGKVRIRTR